MRPDSLNKPARGASPVLAALITCGVAGAALPAAPPAAYAQAGRASKPISINYSDVDVRQVLGSIAEFAKLDVLITPGATGKVTLNIRNRKPEEAIRLVAAAAGLAVLKSGDSYIVGPAAEVKTAASGLGQTVIVPLRFLTGTEAKDNLSKLAPSVSVEAAGKTVAITGLREEVAAARELLSTLDVAAPAPAPVPVVKETEVAKVRYADPAATEKTLKEAFPDLTVTRNAGTLIVTGTRADLEGVGRALLALDAEPPKVEPLPEPPEPRDQAVYRLNYLHGKTTEESIKKAFPGLTVVVGGEATAPPPGIFNPLSLSFLGGGGQSGGGGGFGGGGGGGGQGGAGGQGGGGQGGAGGQNTQQELSRSTQLILIGKRSDVRDAVRLLEETDVAPPRVNIEAEIIEINRENTQDLGVAWDFDGLSARFGLPAGNGFHFGSITRSGIDFAVSLQALVLENKAKILARPNVSVVNNEDASVFIGDLVRFRGNTLFAPDIGTVQGIETIPVGIALLVRPRIHKNGEITLKVHPVVSSVTGLQNNLPQTASREADTTVRLLRDEALVIGGLERNEESQTLRKVPFLGDLPLLGQAFRTRTRAKRRNEIVIIIRARNVDNFGESAKLGAPAAMKEAGK